MTTVWSWRAAAGTAGGASVERPWIAHTFETSQQLEAAHRFREHHRRRTGGIEVAAAGQRFSADILTMTMKERDRARVGGDLFASSNNNGRLRFDLRRETCAEWTARTSLPPPAATEQDDEPQPSPMLRAAAAAAGSAASQPLMLAGAGPAAAADDSGSDDEDDILPAQMLKVLALEIDKPATKVALSSPLRQQAAAAAAEPQLVTAVADGPEPLSSAHAPCAPPSAAAAPRPPPLPEMQAIEPVSESEEDEDDSASESSESSESDSEDEVSLDQLRKVKKQLESTRAQLAPPLAIPALDTVNRTLSDAQKNFIAFGAAQLGTSHSKATAAAGVLVGDHCEVATQALAVHRVVDGSCKKVVWISKNPSHTAASLREHFAPVGGFAVHTFSNVPIAERVGVVLAGGAVCCSCRELVVMHRASVGAAQDAGSVLARQVMKWLRADDTSDVMLVFANCNETLSRSWKGVEDNKWTQTGGAVSFMQHRHPKAAVVYLSSATRTCAAQMAHMDRLPVIWGHTKAPTDPEYLKARQTFAAAVRSASLKLTGRLPFWEIAIPLVCSQKVSPSLAAGQTDTSQLPNADTIEPANETELRSWTRASQMEYWGRRKDHWGSLRLAKLQAATREAKLWDGGSAEMLRDRLLRNDFDPGSLLTPEVTAATSPRGGEAVVELPNDMELMKKGAGHQSVADWPVPTGDDAFSSRMLELTEVLFRLSDYLDMKPLSLHQVVMIVEQKSKRTQVVAALTQAVFDALLSRLTAGGRDDRADNQQTSPGGCKSRLFLSPEAAPQKKNKKSRKATSIWAARDIHGDDEMFDIEAILDSRGGKSKVSEYLVKWEGFEEEENSWEPESNLGSALDLVEAFKEKKKKKKKKKETVSNMNQLMTPRFRAAPDLSHYPDDSEDTGTASFAARHHALEVDEKKDNGRAALAAARASEPWERRLVAFFKTNLPNLDVEPVQTAKAILEALQTNGYSSLSTSERITLLNFVCTEVLSLDDFAGSAGVLEEDAAAADKACRIRERRLKKAGARKRALAEHRQQAEAEFFQEVNDALTQRLEPLGADRWRRNYWWLQSDPGRIWVHTPFKQSAASTAESEESEVERDDRWAYYDSVGQVDSLLGCLDPSGARELRLSSSLTTVYRRICRSMQQSSACSVPRILPESESLLSQIALGKDNGLEKALEDKLLVTDAINECLQKLQIADRREEERVERDKRREAERAARLALIQQQQAASAQANAPSQQAVVQQVVLSPQPLTSPQVPSGWTVVWSGEHAQWYYVDDATQTATWERSALCRQSGDEDAVTDDDFQLAVEQAAAGVGNATAAAAFEKIHHMWALSKIDSEDGIGDVDLRQMAASRYLGYRESWPDAAVTDIPRQTGLLPAQEVYAPAPAEPAAPVFVYIPNSVRQAVERMVKGLEKQAKRDEKEAARQVARDAREAAKQAKEVAKQQLRAQNQREHEERVKAQADLFAAQQAAQRQAVVVPPPQPDSPGPGWTVAYSPEYNQYYYWKHDVGSTWVRPEPERSVLAGSEAASSPDAPVSPLVDGSQSAAGEARPVQLVVSGSASPKSTSITFKPQPRKVEKAVTAAVECIVKKLEKEAKKAEKNQAKAAKKAAKAAAKKLPKLRLVHSVVESDSDDDVPLWLRAANMGFEGVQVTAAAPGTERSTEQVDEVDEFAFNPFARKQQTDDVEDQFAQFAQNPFAQNPFAQNPFSKPPAEVPKLAKKPARMHPAAVTQCVERMLKELEKPEKAAKKAVEKAAKAERDAIKAEKALVRECGKACTELVKSVVLSFPKGYSIGDSKSMGWFKAKEHQDLLALTEKRRSARPPQKRKKPAASIENLDSEDDDVPLRQRKAKLLKTAAAAPNDKKRKKESTEVGAPTDAQASPPKKKKKKSKNSKNAAAAEVVTVVDHGSYKCVKKAVVRAEAALTSDKVGRLKPGDVFKALEVRAVEGQLRVRGEMGWASVRSMGGNNLLEKAEPKDLVVTKSVPTKEEKSKVKSPAKEEKAAVELVAEPAAPLGHAAMAEADAKVAAVAASSLERKAIAPTSSLPAPRGRNVMESDSEEEEEEDTTVEEPADVSQSPTGKPPSMRRKPRAAETLQDEISAEKVERQADDEVAAVAAHDLERKATKEDETAEGPTRPTNPMAETLTTVGSETQTWKDRSTTEIVVSDLGAVEGDAEQMVEDVADMVEEESVSMPVAVFDGVAEVDAEVAASVTGAGGDMASAAGATTGVGSAAGGAVSLAGGAAAGSSTGSALNATAGAAAAAAAEPATAEPTAAKPASTSELVLVIRRDSGPFKSPTAPQDVAKTTVHASPVSKAIFAPANGH